MTPLVLAGIGLLVFAALLVAVIGAGVVTHRETESAADLAALAGATALQHGRDGCASAARSAEVNRAAMVDCSVDGDVVFVVIRKETPLMFGQRLTVTSDARAGPD